MAVGKQIRVTVSGGCAQGPAEDGSAVVALADRRLYEAKAAGRNQIVAVESPVKVGD